MKHAEVEIVWDPIIKRSSSTLTRDSREGLLLVRDKPMEMNNIHNLLFSFLSSEQKIQTLKCCWNVSTQRLAKLNLAHILGSGHLWASICFVFSRTPKKIAPPTPIHNTLGPIPCSKWSIIHKRKSYVICCNLFIKIFTSEDV